MPSFPLSGPVLVIFSVPLPVCLHNDVLYFFWCLLQDVIKVTAVHT